MGDIVRLVRKGRFVGWYVRYIDADGKRKQRASHQPTKEAARRYLLAVEGRIARGAVGIPEPAPLLTVAALVERFVAEYSRPRIKDLTRYRSEVLTCLRRILPMLGGRPAEALAATEVAGARDALVRSHSPASARLSLAYLARTYSWGVKQGIVARNPLLGVERPQTQPSIEFFLRDEVAVLLRLAADRAATGRESDKLLSCCVHLAAHTGLRKGELLGLRWQDLDLETQRLTVARSYRTTPKSGKARYLRLPPASVPVLRAWRPHCPVTTEGLVFPVRLSGPHPHRAMLGLPRLLQAAQLRVPAHPWHALRHTFASHYIMQGGNILALQKILGHSDVKMTLVYAHLAPDFLGEEMGRVKF